jgi:hypothetical protein
MGYHKEKDNGKCETAEIKLGRRARCFVCFMFGWAADTKNLAERV